MSCDGALGLGYLDAGFNFVWLNEMLAKFGDRPMAEFLGKTPDDVWPGLMAAIITPSQAFREAREVQWERWWNYPGDKGRACYRIGLIPREDAEEFAWVMIDITREKAREWDMAEQDCVKKMLPVLWPELAGKTRREVAHGMRNLLTPARVVAQMLHKGESLDLVSLPWMGEFIEKKIKELTQLADYLWKMDASAEDSSSSEARELESSQLLAEALGDIRGFLDGQACRIIPPENSALVWADSGSLIPALELCLLKIAKSAGVVAVEVGVQAGQAIIAMRQQGRQREEVRSPKNCAGDLAIGEAADMGLLLAKRAIENQGGEVLVSFEEDAHRYGEIIIRLPAAVSA